MRELTWKEKIIDSRNDNAISVWGDVLDYALSHLPKIEHLFLITLKRGNLESGELFVENIIDLSENDLEDDTPRIEYKVTSPVLPKFVDTTMKVFKQILKENGLEDNIFEFNEEKLSIRVDELL